MTIPLLYFKSQDSIEQQADLEAAYGAAAGPSVLNAWTGGDFYSVEMLRIVHPEFGTVVFRNSDFWKYEFDRLQPADFTREDGIRSFALVEAYTKAFLDFYLKQQADGLKFLQAAPAEQGVPAHFLGIKVRPGKGRPFDFAGFRVALHAAGFEHVAQAYADARKSHSGFSLSSAELRNWVGDLVRGGHAAEAIAIAEFALSQEASADRYDSLGTAYLAADKTADAIGAFEHALATKPDDPGARSALKQIKRARSGDVVH
jgi:tetratricopeptide (TPR) repeat protein